jgi:hypothetical protein
MHCVLHTQPKAADPQDCFIASNAGLPDTSTASVYNLGSQDSRMTQRPEGCPYAYSIAHHNAAHAASWN